MNYLDANFATALIFPIRGQTDIAQRFQTRTSLACVFSELAEMECRRAFIIRSGKAFSEKWIRLQAILNSGLWRREPVEWRTLSEKAAELMDRHSASVRAGTLDTLHIAHALRTGCTCFLSFDSNSKARILAARCRLKVFPELSASEKSQL